MRARTWVTLALSASIGIAVLAGCSAAPTGFAPPPNVAARHVLPERSWMAPEAKTSDLLYISDNSGRVDVYTYPDEKLVGVLTGFAGPAGLCSDSAGNVFVTNTIGQGILKFHHGAEKPAAGLLDMGNYPDGCAYDPSTKNLAVVNYTTSLGGAGSVAIYANEKGIPKVYQDQNFFAYLFCTYDGQGNLYVDGVNNGTTQTEFAEMPAGGSGSFTDIALDRKIVYPGAVQWDGKLVALEDTSNDQLYRFKISGSKGIARQTVHLKQENSDLLVQFLITGSTVIVPYGTLYRYARSVGVWPYPAGGAPMKTLKVKNATELYGVTVSFAQR
jgi:hypothetical protein